MHQSIRTLTQGGSTNLKSILYVPFGVCLEPHFEAFQPLLT